MLLFLHGTGATSSFWLPHIRQILGLDNHYTDKFLLDLFTISLPGHSSPDKHFTLAQTEDWIEEFIKEKRSKQQELAKNLLFSKRIDGVNMLRDSKLCIFTHSVGGVIALHYTLRNLSDVSRLHLVSIGNNFNPISVRLLQFYFHNIIFKRTLKQLETLSHNAKDMRERTVYSICAENPERKGLRSCEEIVSNYNFSKWYKRLSLEDCLKFNQIPISISSGRWDLLSTVFSINKLKKVLDKQSPLLATKKTNLLGRLSRKNREVKDTLEESKTSAPTSNLTIKIYPWAGHNVVDRISLV